MFLHLKIVPGSRFATGMSSRRVKDTNRSVAHSLTIPPYGASLPPFKYKRISGISVFSMYSLTRKSIALCDHPEGVKAAFGDEVHLFLHYHLRVYDKEGKSENINANYYDKYGAPVFLKDIWTHSYNTIENTLASHFNICKNPYVKNPLIAGFGGGSYLYKPIHNEVDIWNWTGCIPKQSTWLAAEGQSIYELSNRTFPALRGNQIQNNLWDYHPIKEEEEDNNDPLDWIYE